MEWKTRALQGYAAAGDCLLILLKHTNYPKSLQIIRRPYVFTLFITLFLVFGSWFYNYAPAAG